MFLRAVAPRTRLVLLPVARRVPAAPGHTQVTASSRRWARRLLGWRRTPPAPLGSAEGSGLCSPSRPGRLSPHGPGRLHRCRGRPAPDASAQAPPACRPRPPPHLSHGRTGGQTHRQTDRQTEERTRRESRGAPGELRRARLGPAGAGLRRTPARRCRAASVPPPLRAAAEVSGGGGSAQG